MAGMFSLLNSNLRNDGLSSGPGNSSRDDGTGGRATPRARTPVMVRRNYNGDAGSVGKHNVMTIEKLPRSMRRNRIADLHPALRRSVCTLIIAFLAILTGIVIILVEMVAYHEKVSVGGFVVLAVGITFTVVGLVWFKCSKHVLKVKRERMIQVRIKKMQNQMENNFDSTKAVPMLPITSQHAIPWPTRSNCSPDDCQITFTTPNGNHLCPSMRPSFSDSDGDDPQTKEKLIPPTLLVSEPPYADHNLYKNLVSSHNGQLSPKIKQFPVRISKNGEVTPVPSEEKCSSCAVFNFNEENDITSRSFHLNALSHHVR